MRLPIEVIMDFDSPSCVPTTTTLRCCCCCSRLLRRCTMPYAVCLMPFLYDYIRCSFFALISLICLCWRRLADTFVIVVVAFSISTYGMQHAAVFRGCLPPPLFLSLLCFVANKFEFATLSSSCRCIPNPITYVCVLVCECDVRVLVSVCMCGSAFAYAKYLVLQRRRQQQRLQHGAQHQPKNGRQSHMLHLPLIY